MKTCFFFISLLKITDKCVYETFFGRNKIKICSDNLEFVFL